MFISTTIEPTSGRGEAPSRAPNSNITDVEHGIDLGDFYLRPVTMDDVDSYQALLQDADVMRHVGLKEGQIPTDDTCADIVAGAVKTWQTRGYGRWSIFDRASGEFVGFCGFRCEDGVPELLAMVFSKYWGTGVARTAAEACVDHGFRHLGFTRIVSYTRPNNGRAKGLLYKMGAKLTGFVDFHGVTGMAYEFSQPQ